MKVFIGWDSRENVAYEVCRDSMIKHASVELNIEPIMQGNVRADGIYWRPTDTLSSTEFSFTRFLVPHLAQYQGWAVFCDCDFLWRGDIATVMDYADPHYAVMCVQHQYEPKETHKMDNRVQHQYPRKNWSSMMLINCGHPNVVIGLRPWDVNNATGMHLHQLLWAEPHIGALPTAYNYLEGWHTQDDCPNPIGVHYTRGGPWFSGYNDVEYADEWRSYL